jgi:hypothetical protein
MKGLLPDSPLLSECERRVKGQPFDEMLRGMLVKHMVKGSAGSMVYSSKLEADIDFNAACGGLYVENTTELIRMTTEELQAAKVELQSTVNEMRPLVDLLRPLLLEQVQHVRDARTATTVESRNILNVLIDLRKFFLDRTFELEMERAERFLKICREVKSLKADGTLDAFADLILKLGVTD